MRRSNVYNKEFNYDAQFFFVSVVPNLVKLNRFLHTFKYMTPVEFSWYGSVHSA